MKRILHIVPQFQPGGGIERVIMNYFKNLDHSRFTFDILTHAMQDPAYAECIKSYGGRVYQFSSLSPRNITKNGQRFKEILNDTRYDVVHCHMANAAFLYLRIANKHHVPLRILHSHQDHYADTLAHTIRNIPLVNIGKKYANCRIACSKVAGDFLFPSQSYLIINNGIDLSTFHYDINKRNETRTLYGIDNKHILMGQIGRLVPQKNPLFAIKIFAEFHRQVPESTMLFAGDGPMKNEMIALSQSLHIDDSIRFLGNIRDVAQLDNALDVLLMPSLYEGAPLTLIEAQATGLLSFASDTISPEVFISSFARRLPLKASPSQWSQHICETLRSHSAVNRHEGYDQLKNNGFDAVDATRAIERLYAES